MTNTNQNINDDLIKSMLAKFEAENNLGASQILQTAMNLLMLAERNIYLQNTSENKANGFFERELGTTLGSIKLNVPRDRNGDFRPQILPPPYQRDVADREKILQSLLANGYSPNAIKRTMHHLDLHYNPEELDNLKQEYLAIYKQWHDRQLPEDVIALFIDVYHSNTCIDNKVRKTALYVVVGIDFNGQKDLFGLYLYNGHETKGFWLQTLNQLIDRGLKRPLIIVSDDFPGLKDAICALFPNALHQLCFIHMQRNVHRNMGTEDAKIFNQTLKQIKLMNDQQTCKTKFTELCQQYQQVYPSFIKGLLEDADNYFAFKYLPSDAQKHFYTTNIVESVNSILEGLRVRMGGFFQSQDALYTNVFIAINSLKERKWSKGVPKIKSNLYLLQQLFVQNYGEVPKI
jgi:putative transposase